MLINEVTAQVGLSKRAIKLYEEKGLLHVEKNSNGYRNYTEEDIRILKEISVYRKLGIRIQDIKILLAEKDSQLLERIYKEKKEILSAEQQELDALEVFIQNHNIEEVYSIVDYQNIAHAMQDMIPGFYGYYFMNHFLPYLQIKITTPGQQEAYERIVNFWDNTDIKIPLLMRIFTFPMYKLTPKPSIDKMAAQIDEQLRRLLNPTEEEYLQLREKTRKNVKLKNSLLYKYHPAFIAQRKFMKRLQDCGYNDIFIPSMISLSPKYKEYHDALMNINSRLCDDLGLYYDSSYNLIMKKQRPDGIPADHQH